MLKIVTNKKRWPTNEQKVHGIDPSTGAPLWKVPVATPKDLDDAVEASNAAFKVWSATIHEERSHLMIRFAAALDEYRKEFCRLVVQETGKPVGSL